MGESKKKSFRTLIVSLNLDFANSNLTLFTSNTKPESRVKEDSGYAERHHGGTNADRLSKRKPRRVFGLGLLYFPSDPPPAIFVVVAEDLEGAYLSSILNVSADASAGIIITYTHNPERFRRILRQFAEVNDIGRLLPGHEFNRHIQMPADDLVHRRLQLRHLLIRGAAGELVIALGLLSLYMRIPGPRTPEHLHHRSIQNMLGRMHRRILFLIMRVQNRFFHEIIR